MEEIDIQELARLVAQVLKAEGASLESLPQAHSIEGLELAPVLKLINGSPVAHRVAVTLLKGADFKYENFTPAQLAALKGSAFKYEDFTPAQIENLKLTFSRLTPENILELQKPAKEATAAAIEATTKAETASTAAGNAAVLALAAKESTIVAIGLAETATNNANTAKNTANAAADAAGLAKQGADTAKDLANSAAAAANVAKGAAETQASRAKLLADNPPRITSGIWEVFDTSLSQYKSTNIPARGPEGKPLMVIDGYYAYWDEIQSKYVKSIYPAAASVNLSDVPVTFTVPSSLVKISNVTRIAGTINSTNGVVVADASIWYAKIEVSGYSNFNAQVMNSANYYGGAFFTENNVFISGFGYKNLTSGERKDIPIPANAAYVLYSYLTDAYASPRSVPVFNYVELTAVLGGRTNIESGETIPILMYKIKKWFSDLGALAFKSVLKWSELTEKPDFSPVATTGNASDIAPDSTVPFGALESTEINSTTKWKDVFRRIQGQISNIKNSLGTLSSKNSLAYSELTGLPALGTLAAKDSLSYSDLTGKPTIPGLINHLGSDSTIDALTAKMGKYLEDKKVNKTTGKVSELINDLLFQTEAQVSAKIAALVNGAPEALDTLAELAEALQNNEHFGTAVMEVVGTKVDKESGKSLVLDTEITKLAGLSRPKHKDISLTVGGWVQVGEKWTYIIYDTNILADSLVHIVPNSDTLEIFQAAEFYPAGDTIAGRITLFAKNKPTVAINLTYVIV